MRYAVYYMPGDQTPLGRFGAALFGRWPDGRSAPIEHDHPERAARTGRATRYGFHATLKAPFRLADGVDPATLHGSLEAIAAQLTPIPLARLAVAEHGLATLALCLQGDPPDALPALAATCVRTLDGLRAPLDDAERARRQPERLSPLERERLEQWGYPWVLDRFRFHMTLARGGEGSEHFRAWLEERVAAAGAHTGCLDRLALCRESAPGAPLLRIADIALPGAQLAG